MPAIKPDIPEWLHKLMLRGVSLFFVALFGFGLGFAGDKLEVEWLARLGFATTATAVFLGAIVVVYGWFRIAIHLLGKLRGGHLKQHTNSKVEP